MQFENMFNRMCDIVNNIIKVPAYVAMIIIALCVCVSEISSCCIQTDKNYYEWRIQKDKHSAEESKAFWDRDKPIGVNQ